MSEKTASLVSIIVPTRNCSRLLARCLASISQFVKWPYEVIVVDDRSTDGTQSVAKNFGAKLVVLGNSSLRDTRSIARNRGAAAARGDYLLFLDSDMRVESDVVAECVRGIGAEDADAINIPEISVGNKFWARVRQAERLGYKTDVSHTSPAFIRRETFFRIGGFDPLLVAGEDYDLDLRLRSAKAKIVSIEDPLLHDEGELTFPKYMMKSFAYGRFMKTFAEKQPRAMLSRFAPIRPGAISFSIKTEMRGAHSADAAKSYVLLVPFLKVSQMIFVLLGMIVAALLESKGKAGSTGAGSSGVTATT